MTLRRQLGLGAYRGVGRAVCQALGAFDFVETVFLRRTAATGEVSFGRSDIDLTIVVSAPLVGEADSRRMLRLARCYQALRTLAPVVGECETGTREELLRSYRADPYRASIDRRTALTVYGERLRIPEIPIRPQDALTWLMIWLPHYLPWAMRLRSVRNMRKFALEMWNAARTATGDIPEPYPTRTLAEAAWRRQAGAAFPLRDGAGVDELAAVCGDIVDEVHRRLCPPLAAVNSVRFHRVGSSEWVLLPPGTPPPPVEAGIQRAFFGSPAALDLLIQHVNPRMFQQLPEPLLELGIRRPGRGEWLDFCRRFAADPRLLRRPAFVTGRAGAYYAPELIRPGARIARMLRDGAEPVWTTQRDERLRAQPPSLRECYLELLPELHAEIEQAWRDLDDCRESRAHPRVPIG